MKLKTLLATMLIMVMTIGPALAAHCSSACGNHDIGAGESKMKADMPDCHHAASKHLPKKTQSKADGHCHMAGCHTVSAAFLHSSSSFTDDFPSSHAVQRDFSAFSADLSPPIKPPA
jgi:hypothetical protein